MKNARMIVWAWVADHKGLAQSFPKIGLKRLTSCNLIKIKFLQTHGGREGEKGLILVQHIKGEHALSQICRVKQPQIGRKYYVSINV